jgi:hypothetical protein
MHPGLMEDLMYARQAEFAREAVRLQRERAVRQAQPARRTTFPSLSVRRRLRQYWPLGRTAPMAGG